jgi:hypothetical protein
MAAYFTLKEGRAKREDKNCFLEFARALSSAPGDYESRVAVLWR